MRVLNMSVQELLDEGFEVDIRKHRVGDYEDAVEVMRDAVGKEGSFGGCSRSYNDEEILGWLEFIRYFSRGTGAHLKVTTFMNPRPAGENNSITKEDFM